MSGSDSEAAGAPRLARPEWECLPDGRVDCLINSDTDPVVLSRNFSDPSRFVSEAGMSSRFI